MEFKKVDEGEEYFVKARRSYNQFVCKPIRVKIVAGWAMRLVEEQYYYPVDPRVQSLSEEEYEEQVCSIHECAQHISRILDFYDVSVREIRCVKVVEIHSSPVEPILIGGGKNFNHQFSEGNISSYDREMSFVEKMVVPGQVLEVFPENLYYPERRSVGVPGDFNRMMALFAYYKVLECTYSLEIDNLMEVPNMIKFENGDETDRFLLQKQGRRIKKGKIKPESKWREADDCDPGRTRIVVSSEIGSSFVVRIGLYYRVMFSKPFKIQLSKVQCLRTESTDDERLTAEQRVKYNKSFFFKYSRNGQPGIHLYSPRAEMSRQSLQFGSVQNLGTVDARFSVLKIIRTEIVSIAKPKVVLRAEAPVYVPLEERMVERAKKRKGIKRAEQGREVRKLEVDPHFIYSLKRVPKIRFFPRPLEISEDEMYPNGTIFIPKNCGSLTTALKILFSKPYFKFDIM